MLLMASERDAKGMRRECEKDAKEAGSEDWRGSGGAFARRFPRPSQGFARSAAGNDYFVLPRSLRATFWRDFAEMYARAVYFGNISVFCTLRAGKTLSEGTFHEYLARKARLFCPRVQNTLISPFFDACGFLCGVGGRRVIPARSDWLVVGWTGANRAR